MKLLRAALAIVLSYALGVQPAVAQVATRINVPTVSGVGAAAAAPIGVSGAGALQLQTFALTPSASLSPALFAPAFTAAPSITVPSAALAASPAAIAAQAAAAPALSPAAAIPAASARLIPAAVAAGTAKVLAPAATPAERLTQIRVVADKAVEDIDRADVGAARGKADAQFAALTQERLAASAGDGVEAPSAVALADLPARAYLDKPTTPVAGGEKADVPAPKPAKAGFFQVFKDPERNKTFWRYVKGYAIFLIGYEMYVVAQPYLISSMVKNALNEKHDGRAGNAAAVTELVRSERSMSRIAQWVAQFFSYATIPLFTKNVEKDGPRKWLVKATFVRAGALAGIAGVFFATGLIGLTTMWVLFGLIAVQSFFQGIAITSEGAATTRMLGDKSVTSDERTRANSILTIIGAVISIIGPLIAGLIAKMGPVAGKSGVGGAVIYAIYAGAMALTAFIYASIKMFAGPGKNPEAALAADGSAPAPAAKRTFLGVLKSLFVSIKDGTRIVLKDRLLRTMLILSTISSLFSDPLVFNVLPEYIEKLAASSAGTVGAIMHVPVLGWFITTLTSTPMGNFALMVVMASVGSIVAALTIKPLTKLFTKMGFKTEEAQTVPFYFLAALEAPLFFLMIHTPTMLAAVALYGLQSLAVGYIGIALSGLYQKNLGGQKDENVNKILAADSLIGIAAAILSTVVYGFILTNIPIATSLLIAAIATGVVSAIRLAAPFLSFTKAQRKPPEPPAAPENVPPAHAMPSTGDHNGPNSILSTHL